MPSNFYILFLVALIPMIVGFIYYNPRVVGSAWMKVNGFTEESLKGGNMAVTFGVSYVLSLMLAFGLIGLTIHQSSIYSLLVPEVGDTSSAIYRDFIDFMTKYGDRHRTVSHGLVHGFAAALTIVLPVMATNSLFEKRGWKYILINVSYWTISLMLMGAIIAATLKFDM